MQKIITEERGDNLVILLQNDLDASDQQLAHQLQRTRHGGHLSILVDCASLECIKTLGFCHFVNQLLLLKVYEVDIALLNLSQKQQHILRLLQVEPFFHVIPDLGEAPSSE
ncbi:hypothetical protein [Rufibacter hautae]|uniref:STAS domain-containing protein n=1 Tax=Rufibacter hautae TaxID=2595005 RepID=A0A5B6T9L5_9BACT|nr:hypothetical protein [Rufibacter hautae]KAA3436886.1 hypothetical protein FOA19_21160 [Rufibacter hautae]